MYAYSCQNGNNLQKKIHQKRTYMSYIQNFTKSFDKNVEKIMMPMQDGDVYSTYADVDDLKNITATIKQLHKNMEQEAEPEGGKIADKYGKQIEKYEKMYKKRKSELEKVFAKIDKLEQY